MNTLTALLGFTLFFTLVCFWLAGVAAVATIIFYTVTDWFATRRSRRSQRLCRTPRW